MNFNFNNLSNTSFSSESTQYLKPYDIYKVNLTKFEKSELKGKDGSSVYPVIAIEFTGIGDVKGIFSQNIFIPTTEADFERKENQNHKLMPSRFDHFQYTLMQIVEAINPTGAQKIKEAASKIKTIDQFIELISKALSGKNNVDVYLKLVGQNTNGRVYSRLPNACLIGSDGNPAALNFINADSSKLFFSSYEMNQMKAYKEAKPTNMDSVEASSESSEDNLDLDDIEL